MKPKNIMLLGFVNKAVDYLDRHMDEEPDTRLAELKNIDLNSLKEELSDYLDSSLGTMQSTMSTLLKAGNEAFDQFIEKNHNENISDQLVRMFDVDFDENKKTNQEELAKLLSFYNLEDFDAENSETVDLPYLDEYMDEIKKNITSDDVEDVLVEEEEIDPAVDSIFSEIVEHENTSKPTEKIVAPDLRETKSEDDNNIEVFDELPVETVEEEPIEELETEETSVEEKPIEELDTEETLVEEESIEEVETEETLVEEESIEELETEETRTYVSTLINDLREQMLKEDALIAQKEENNKEVYEQIKNSYPYLPEGFVKSAYELKESLIDDYALGLDLIILHRISFNDVDNLRKFVEIGLNHDYTINADENKMIVDILKQFTNDDGKILTNIFEVANQGYLLEGNYEGYNIIVNE